MGVTLLQWNANSLSAHIHELKYFLDQQDRLPDIICVQETFLKPTLSPSVSGYSILRRDGVDGHGGVAILVKNDISYFDFTSYENVEGISIKIATTSGPLQIFNFYISPSSSFDEGFFQQVFSFENALVCGDFNAKSTLWGSPKADSRGKSIENILQQSNLVVLNTGSPTRIFTTGESHIDLTFISPRYANMTNWEVLENTCGSDHNMIKVDFRVDINHEDVFAPQWLFEKADWPKFSFLCDTYLSEIDFECGLETLNESITAAIIDAAKDSIPKSSGRKRRKYARFWNDKCKIAVDNRDKAKRALKIDSPNDQFIEYKRLKATATKTVKEEKRKSWRSFCSTLSHRTKLGNVWRVVKSLNNNSQSESIPELKIKDGSARTNMEKANTFAKHFSNVSSNTNYSNRFKRHKSKFEKENENIYRHRTNNTSVLNVPFKMSEFKKALKRCKNTSPGKDGLCYEMFRHMSANSQMFVLKYFNRIWEKGFVPTAWTHAIVVPILKPNKSKSDPVSYRPIALTSNFSKLLERMIVFRVNWYMEKFSLYNFLQSGFRKNRNTVDQLLRLSDDILKSLGNKSYVLGVFLDFDKAYDMIWRKGVLFKLDKLGFDGNVFNWISSFLQNRTIQVRIGGTLSYTLPVDNGLPQGSVLSPFLFLIAINDLLPQNVKYSLFADDSAIWKTGRNVNHLARQIQEALNGIQKWCNMWGFRISALKSNFIFFHKGKKRKINLTLNGQQLTQVEKVKFLGLVFDEKLSWKHHVQHLVEKCQKRINILKVLSGSKWGASKETMVLVYKTFIRSLLDYGSVVYNSACKSIKEKLDIIQSQSLRICCSALKCTPVNALEVECGVIPLELRRKQLMMKVAIKYQHMPDNPAQECFKDCYQLYYGKYNVHFQPICLKVRKLITEVPPASCNILVDTIPPWEYEPPILDTSLHSKLNKKTDNPHFMLSSALEYMSAWSASLHIYTDGSKCGDRTACAFHIPAIKFSKKIRLPDFTTVYMAEMVAILEALQFLLAKPPLSSVIFTDSLSSIQTLECESETSPVSQEIKYCMYQLWCQGVPITISWVPSHVGIIGNEMADKLAKEALSKEHVDLNVLPVYSDLYRVVEENILGEWQCAWNSSSKGRFYHKIQPKVSFQVKFSDNYREKQTTLTRLRFGKGLLNDVLHLMKKCDSELCDFCQIKENVSHFLLDCTEYNDMQVALFDKVLTAGEQPSIETLLGEKRWYDDVFDYVIKTGKKV